MANPALPRFPNQHNQPSDSGKDLGAALGGQAFDLAFSRGHGHVCSATPPHLDFRCCQGWTQEALKEKVIQIAKYLKKSLNSGRHSAMDSSSMCVCADRDLAKLFLITA